MHPILIGKTISAEVRKLTQTWSQASLGTALNLNTQGFTWLTFPTPDVEEAKEALSYSKFCCLIGLQLSGMAASCLKSQVSVCHSLVSACFFLIQRQGRLDKGSIRVCGECLMCKCYVCIRMWYACVLHVHSACVMCLTCACVFCVCLSVVHFVCKYHVAYDTIWDV